METIKKIIFSLAMLLMAYLCLVGIGYISHTWGTGVWGFASSMILGVSAFMTAGILIIAWTE